MFWLRVKELIVVLFIANVLTAIIYGLSLPQAFITTVVVILVWGISLNFQ